MIPQEFADALATLDARTEDANGAASETKTLVGSGAHRFTTESVAQLQYAIRPLRMRSSDVRLNQLSSQRKRPDVAGASSSTPTPLETGAAAVGPAT
jgi:hypothetical protein